VKLFRKKLEKGYSISLEELKKMKSTYKGEYINKVMADDKAITQKIETTQNKILNVMGDIAEV
jgi:hypothetical protein